MADAPKKDERTVKATVAPRRSVITEFRGRPHLPGAELMLPATEAKRLTELGFLVDAKAAPIPAAPGPTFEAQGGPSVTPG